jgi:phosphate-selective porin OprO and OprP
LRALAIGLVFTTLAGNTARAQTPSLPASAFESDSSLNSESIEQRMARLEEEVRQLRQPPTAQNTALDADATSKAEASPPKDDGYVVGSNLAVKSEFRNGLFLWFATPNNDFTMHLGGWAQFDNLWWDQSPALLAPPGARPGHGQGVASGAPAGGIGNLQDGVFFRRIRLSAEGTFWENGEYRLIPALENDQFNTIGLDEFWFGAKDLPVIGSLRLGHVKNAIGLEGDMTASSRCMTFMERSAYSESIELNQNFVTGIWLSDNYLDQRMTWQMAAFRPDNGSSSGVFFGDGQSGFQARLTGLPIYEDEGRDLLHLAISGGVRNGTINNAVSPLRVFQLRARPELRDDDPAAGGPGVVPNADSNRFIDTGVISARDDFLLGLETLMIHGPFSFQAEYGWNFLNGAVGVAPSGTTFHPAIVPSQDYVFNGGYLQIAYTLTGENRAYDRRVGTLAREYYGKSGPYSNAWLIRDDEGHLHCGYGAWEIAARYSYVDLNDGIGLNRIQGGILNGVTLALNWYANTNFNVMCDWVYNQRSDLAPGTFAGWTSGFGIEVQFQF